MAIGGVRSARHRRGSKRGSHVEGNAMAPPETTYKSFAGAIGHNKQNWHLAHRRGRLSGREIACHTSGLLGGTTTQAISCVVWHSGSTHLRRKAEDCRFSSRISWSQQSCYPIRDTRNKWCLVKIRKVQG